MEKLYEMPDAYALPDEVTSLSLRCGDPVTLAALSQPKQSYPTVLLGIANLPSVSQAQALGALRSYREGLAERLEHVTARAESQRPLSDHVEYLFDHSLMMLETEKNWIESVIQKMEAKNDES